MSKPHGVPALRGQVDTTSVPNQKLFPIENPHKGKVPFSNRVSLDVQTIHKGRSMPSSRWPIPNELSGPLDGSCLIRLCLGIFFFYPTSIHTWVFCICIISVLCFYGISVYSTECMSASMCFLCFSLALFLLVACLLLLLKFV